ncbi:MAG TPA: LssY C-terminal domain-containing protein [Terriglobales bacterium]|nr:LssY C-terminal domain-containing protein [Terriglobales bacterium]
MIARSQSETAAPVKSYSDSSTPATQPPAPAAATNRKLKYQIEVPGDKLWTDTGIDLLPQDQVSIAGAGTPLSSNGQSSSCDPQGQARSWWDLLHALPVNTSGRDALIGLVGDTATSVPFLVGSKFEQKVPQAGRLFLGVNEVQNISAPCTYKVSITIKPAAAAKTVASAQTSSPQLSADLLKQIPRRVSDSAGNPGDMVNFIIIGPEKSLQTAFASAGWVAVDRTKQAATVHAILSSLGKQSYVEMPMSELYLFNRPQDYAFARAEPLEVVASRHHLRIWRAPFAFNSQPVWVGAATHDIGFARDDRNGGVTHKIDPAIDLEREFVGKSLNATGAIGSLGRVSPSDPLLNANTATGEAFHSDGQILVMSLQ